MKAPAHTPEWHAANAERRAGYLGKLELLHRLQQQLDGERATAVYEARYYGATIDDIVTASGLKTSTVRALLR